MRSSSAKSNPGACSNTFCASPRPPTRPSAPRPASNRESQEIPMKRFLPLVLAATCFAAFQATAQNVPEIQFDSAPNALTTPDDIYLGEVGGVATDSKGNIYVYTRTGHP